EEAEFSLIQQELQKLDSEFKEGKVKLSALNDHLSIYDQDKRRFDEDRERLTQKNEQLINDLNKLAEQLTFVQEKIDELTKQERILTDNKEKRQAEIQQLQVLLDEQEERVKNSRANTRKLEEELAGLKEQHSTLSSELKMMNEIEAQETEEQIEEKIHHYSH